jgi:hypothetical protein
MSWMLTSIVANCLGGLSEMVISVVEAGALPETQLRSRATR